MPDTRPQPMPHHPLTPTIALFWRPPQKGAAFREMRVPQVVEVVMGIRRVLVLAGFEVRTEDE